MNPATEINCCNWFCSLTPRFGYGPRCMAQHCQVRTGTHWVFPQCSRCGRALRRWAVENLGLDLGKVLKPGESRKRLVLLISAEFGAESQAAQSSEISMAEASRMVRASRHSTLRNLA